MLMQAFCVIASSKSPVLKEFLSGVCAAVEDFERVKGLEVSIPHRPTHGLRNAIDQKLSGSLQDGRRVLALRYFAPDLGDDDESNGEAADSATPVDRVELEQRAYGGEQSTQWRHDARVLRQLRLTEQPASPVDKVEPEKATWCAICGDPNARLSPCDRCGEVSLCTRCNEYEVCACTRHWSDFSDSE